MCPFDNCGKSFSEKGNMKSHYKKHLLRRSKTITVSQPKIQTDFSENSNSLSTNDKKELMSSPKTEAETPEMSIKKSNVESYSVIPSRNLFSINFQLSNEEAELGSHMVLHETYDNGDSNFNNYPSINNYLNFINNNNLIFPYEYDSNNNLTCETNLFYN